ncbi:MAG: CapA family protein [Gammaproteobacteria bacterium]
MPSSSQENTPITTPTSDTVLDIGFAEIRNPEGDPNIVSRQTVMNPTFKIAAVGDIMLGTNYPFNHLPDQGIDLLEAVKPILQRMDISFGNLEGVLVDEGEPAKKCLDLTRCYVFRSPVSYAALLKESGFTMMSLANNHARDFGEQGRLSTMAALDEQGILHSGIVDDFAITTLKNRKFIMIAFAPFRGANDMLDLPLAGKLVKSLAQEYDVVMVSMHGGAEGEDMTRLPFATEYFYDEDRGDVVKFARTMVDNGADIVLGHGPHVPRAIELYKNRLIAYSLGNFATYYGINVKGRRGYAPLLEIDISHQGAFLGGKIHSFKQNRPNGPQIDIEHNSAKLIQVLSQHDFPDNMLQLSPTGNIRVLTQESVDAR